MLDSIFSSSFIVVANWKRRSADRPVFSLDVIMGKLNIAHHKSYHPYRRDNIERVRRDEEEARLKETAAEGRILLAVRDSASLPNF